MDQMDIVTTAREIPKAPYYVLTNDTFMSGWGPARDKINTLIFPCETWEEAEVVAANASRRTDQSRVRIVIRKPRLTDGHLYQVKTRDTYNTWYLPGSFGHDRSNRKG